MAEKEAKKEAAEKKEAPAAPPKEKAAKAGGGMMKAPIVVAIVMVMEAVILFAGFKFLGSTPKVVVGAQFTNADAAAATHGEGGEASGAKAEGGGHGEGANTEGPAAVTPKGKIVEVTVIEFKAPNKRSGRTFLYDVSIAASVKGEASEKVKAALKDNEARVADRVRTIIAESDPEKLGGGAEPGLETLRRQVKYQLDEIVGEGLIEEILVKKCIPFRTDY
jgi:flagellar basal body-associated protein FliL